MPLPRMTTRRWMVVVAVVGAISAAGAEMIRLKRAASAFPARVAYHASQQSLNEFLVTSSKAEEVQFRRFYAEMRREGVDRAEADKLEREMTEDRRREVLNLTRKIDHHRRMKTKYLAAARRPWLPVPPDPPPPK